MNIIFNLQLFGGKGSKVYTSQPAPPTEEELRLQRVQAAYAEQTMPNAISLQNKAADMLWHNPGIVPVDYTNMGNTAVAGAQNLQEKAAALGRGELDPNYLKNQMAYINDGLQGTVGSTLNGLAGKGILNSSVTSAAMGDIGRGVTAQLAGQYNNNLNQASSNIEQQRGLLSQPMELLNSAQNASIDIPNKLLTMSRGEVANTSNLWSNMASQRIASKPDVAVVPGNGGLLGGLAQGVGAYLGACFIAGTKISTPTGDKNIEDIKVGDEIISLNDTIETVTYVMPPTISPDNYLTIEGEYGGIVTTTSTQEFVTTDGDIHAPNLVGESCLTEFGEEIIVSVTPAEKELVYDLSTTGNNVYYANGFAVKGRE